MSRGEWGALELFDRDAWQAFFEGPSRAKVSSMTANCSGGRRSFAAWPCGR